MPEPQSALARTWQSTATRDAQLERLIDTVQQLVDRLERVNVTLTNLAARLDHVDRIAGKLLS